MAKMTQEQKIPLILMMVTVVVGSLFYVIPRLIINAQPEQQVQVEVVGKRTESDGDLTDFLIIAFQCPDGSVKEIEIGTDGSRENKKLYDSIKKGDTGILAYKERKNAKSYKDRRFISFGGVPGDGEN